MARKLGEKTEGSGLKLPNAVGANKLASTQNWLDSNPCLSPRVALAAFDIAKRADLSGLNFIHKKRAQACG
jgi:hypothetical protein